MNKTKILNWVNIVLMGLLLLMHFVPFWSCDGISTSIQAYVWFPEEHKQLEEYFVSNVNISDSYVANQIVLMPILVLFFSIAGIVVSVWNEKNIFASLIPMVCGIIGIWGYLAKPVFQLGMSWGFHLALCLGMLVVSIIKIVFLFRKE